MGCDYYVYSVFKIIHSNGITLLKLQEEPRWLYGGSNTDKFLVHPTKRTAVAYLQPCVDDILIYKKGTKSTEPYITQYFELINEFIKYHANDTYETKNKIILDNTIFKHDTNAESLKNIDDINEIYMIELRADRP
jgi:hypothetical protein